MRRSKHPEWAVVFKSIITTNYLISYGNERFIQNLASSVVNLKSIDRLANFNDMSSTLAYDMSTYLRRYARYLSARVTSYRALGLDLSRSLSNENLSVRLRLLSVEQLVALLNQMSNQLDALLAFDVTPDRLSNGIIDSAFSLLYQDFTKLYLNYQAAIIRLLESFFKIHQVKRLQELLDAYKKFLVRMNKVSDLMHVVEQVGIDRGELPKMSRWPEGVPPALLERHLERVQQNNQLGSKRRKSISCNDFVPRLENPYASIVGLAKRNQRQRQSPVAGGLAGPQAGPQASDVDEDKKKSEDIFAPSAPPMHLLLHQPDLIQLDPTGRPAHWVQVDM